MEFNKSFAAGEIQCHKEQEKVTTDAGDCSEPINSDSRRLDKEKEALTVNVEVEIRSRISVVSQSELKDINVTDKNPVFTLSCSDVKIERQISECSLQVNCYKHLHDSLEIGMAYQDIDTDRGERTHSKQVQKRLFNSFPLVFFLEFDMLKFNTCRGKLDFLESNHKVNTTVLWERMETGDAVGVQLAATTGTFPAGRFSAVFSDDSPSRHVSVCRTFCQVWRTGWRRGELL